MFEYFKNFMNNTPRTPTAPEFNYYYNRDTNSLIKTPATLEINERITRITKELYESLFGKEYQRGPYGDPVLVTEKKPHSYYYWSVEKQSWVIDDDKSKLLYSEQRNKCLQRINELSLAYCNEHFITDPIELEIHRITTRAVELLSSKMDSYSNKLPSSDKQVQAALQTLYDCGYPSTDKPEELVASIKEQLATYNANLFKANRLRQNAVAKMALMDDWQQLKKYYEEFLALGNLY